MVDDLYDFTLKKLPKNTLFLASGCQSCSAKHLLYAVLSLFIQGNYEKHKDLNLIQKEANGHQKILRGSPIMTLSLFAPMRYDIWGLEKEDSMNPYEFKAEKNYTNNIESHLLESGSIRSWHPRDDKRYMHSLDFPPEVTKHKTKTFCRFSYVWR
jgi:hypothetical protein